MKTTFTIDYQNYQVEIYRRVKLPPQNPRLVVVAYQPNESARQILRTCLLTIQHYTPEAHELWVVDNFSPRANIKWLLMMSRINLVLNLTAPIPPEKRNFWNCSPLFYRQQRWGSYANAIGLELARRIVDPETHYFMSLHMDTMPCHEGWLSYLLSKMDARVAVASVHLHSYRVPQGSPHVLGSLIDFQRCQQLNLDFLPALPQYDTGDRLMVGLQQAGYTFYACRNTYNEPELAAEIPESSPRQKAIKNLPVFRAVNSQGEVIFLHLGRGVRKSTGQHHQGVTPKEWNEFATTYLLD